jgi:hypothetical protein
VALVMALLQLLLGPLAPVPEPAGHLVARVPVGATVAVRDRPGGRVLARLPARTEFGTPQTLAVLERRDGWLGISTTALPNDQLGWIDPRSMRLSYRRTRLELRADLSRRELSVLSDERVVRRMRVTIGRPGSHTPIGRFAVTDKLGGAAFGPYFGCCILALSGRQPNLPPGWTGGDLLAIHGGPAWSIGGELSAGCLHAREADLRWLMRRVPPGTRITIHP